MGSFWIDNMPGKPNTAPIVPSASSPQMPTGSELSNPPTIPQDFNLGGYQPAPGMDMSPDKSGWATPPHMYDAGTGMGFTDPPVSTQPQPYQQGPDWSQIGWGHSPDVIEAPPGGYPNQNQPLPPWMQPKTGNPTAGGWLSGRGSLGQMGQHGGFFGGIANAMQSPNMQQVLQQAGARRGGGFWGPLRGAVQSMARPSFGQTLMNSGGQPQGNGVPTGWAPASQAGPMFQQPRPQPMNPSQQSGQVQMQSPDGQHIQYVNAEHVPHYQGLGAQVYNGSSYGGGNG